MGEIADMMLDGILCEGCGVYMGDEVGFPRLCNSCKSDERNTPKQVGPLKVKCPKCGKQCRGKRGLKAHTESRHL
jgi:hypothetical protein